jgi:hypothetical protein
VYIYHYIWGIIYHNTFIDKYQNTKISKYKNIKIHLYKKLTGIIHGTAQRLHLEVCRRAAARLRGGLEQDGSQTKPVALGTRGMGQGRVAIDWF